MAVIADLSDAINLLTGGGAALPDHDWFYIDGRIQAAAAAATVAGRYTSLWQNNKTNGANGAVPPALASAAAPTVATIGALSVDDPTGGRQHWITGIEGAINALGTLILYDRLLHCSGASGTVTTAQTITGGAVTRYNNATTSVGNQLFVEIYTAVGATATTITCSYTNSAGTAGRTTKATAFGGTGLNEVQRMIPLPLQDGDNGVLSVQSVTVLATTATAGSFGITIARPLACAINGGIAGGFARDLIAGLPSMPEKLVGCCLALAWFANTTTVPMGLVGIHMLEK